MPHRFGNRQVTHLQHYAYRLAVRPGFSILHSSRKLFLMYVLDAFMTVEGNRLNWIRQNQKAIRAENYVNLAQFVNAREINDQPPNDLNNNQPDFDVQAAQQPAQARPHPAQPAPNAPPPLGQQQAQQGSQNRVEQIDFDGVNIGQRIILPSTFRGSKRQFTESYRDAMAVVSRHGKPDLFATMTANQMWPELQENTELYQDVNFRPDLEARVMKLKIDAFVKDVRKNGIFGRAVAYIQIGRAHV